MPSGANPNSHLNHRHKVYKNLTKIYVSIPKSIFVPFNAIIQGTKRSQLINQLIEESYSAPFPATARGKDCIKFQIEIDKSNLKTLDNFIEGRCQRSHYVTALLKKYLLQSIDV